MSRLENVDNAIWSDPDFEALSPDATLLYLWSFTNPRCGMAGMYKVSHRTMTESKVTLEALPVTLTELGEGGFVFYEDSVIWIRTRVKHLRVKSSQMARSVANDLIRISPEHPLRQRFLDAYASEQWLRNELQPIVNRTSGEVHENTDEQGGSVKFTRTSPDVPSTSTRTRSSSSSKQTTKGAVDQGALPSSLPERLGSVADEVLAMLEALQSDRGGNVPTLRGVGLAIDGHQDRDHVKVARELQHWALAGTGQAKPIVDWARTYANFLERSPAAKPLQAVAKPDYSIYDKAAGL